VSVAGGDEVRIDASLQDDISAALAKIEQRIKSVEDAVSDLGRKGAKGGAEFAAGVNAAADAADDLGDESRQASREVDNLGDKAGKAGAKAAAGSTGLELFAKKAKKAGKSAGGLKTILTAFKIAGVVSGVFALAGGISALAAGAVIAVGAISPMIGVLAGALPIFAAVKLGMLAWKLAATQLEDPLTRIKNQFTELGPVIAKGGLLSGVNYFANSIGKLVKVTGTGLSGLGGEIGAAARNAGDLAKSAPFLAQVSRIFAGLRPILKFILSGLMAVAQAALNLLEAALPAAQGMAAAFEWVATSLRNWTAAQLANGKMAAFISKAWEMFLQLCGIVVDVVIGLYHVFKIGAGFIGNMGQSIHDAAWEFRQWTESAAGQERITQYFRDSLPALQEMGKLLKFIVTGFAGLGANQNVAPLLAQINSQLLPALADLVMKLSGQGGLGPAVIDAATALAQLFAGLDFSGLTMFVQAIAGVLQALVWLQQNVPGANLVISGLLFSFLGFKLLGPVFSIVGRGAEAFSWMVTAAKATEDLSFAQKAFQLITKPLGFLFSGIGKVVMEVLVPALRMIAIAGVGALRALSTALFTTPIGWIILAIIAVIAAIYLLWTKCAWFRDLVMAVWNAIKTAAIATWDALKVAFFAVVDALVAAWNWVKDAAMAVWNALKTAWQATVDFIVTVAMWIWDHGLKQVFSVIVTAFKVYFAVMTFIVKTAIYIIVAIITLIAIIVKYVWDRIVEGAKTAWNIILAVVKWAVDLVVGIWNAIYTNAVKPTIDLIVSIWNWLWTNTVAGFKLFISWIQAGWNWLWTNVIKPVIDFIVGGWNWLWDTVTGAFNVFVGWLKAGWDAIWGWLKPIFDVISISAGIMWDKFMSVLHTVEDVVTTVWNKISGFLSGIWDGMKSAGTSVWDGIKDAATTVGDFIKGVWQKVVDVVKGAWNFIAKGWNSIPDITVPDWVPLLGGKTFGLPKLPTLWHGGEAPGGTAIVGEHGPEPIVQNGAVTGMVGLNGPEITGIPKGGYVVPNLRTLNALPGLAKTLPSGVAAAVARSVPGYAGALAPSSSGGSSSGGGATAALAAQVGRLATAVASQRPSVNVSGAENVYREVVAAQRALDREEKLKTRYRYQGGRG
jgi:phage-related protein